MATKQSKSKPYPNGVILLGTTTPRRMIAAALDENDPLYNRNTFFAGSWPLADIETNPEPGGEVVYLYYHPKKDMTIMTNVKGDVVGITGASAGFKGKVLPEEIKTRGNNNICRTKA